MSSGELIGQFTGCTGPVSSISNDSGGRTWVGCNDGTISIYAPYGIAYTQEIHIVPPSKEDATAFMASIFSEGSANVVIFGIGIFIFFKIFFLSFKKGWEHGKKIANGGSDDNSRNNSK